MCIRDRADKKAGGQAVPKTESKKDVAETAEYVFANVANCTSAVFILLISLKQCSLWANDDINNMKTYGTRG